MLGGVKIFSSNPIWRHILNELGATVVDTPTALDINFDDIEPEHPVSAPELKALILHNADSTKILEAVFGSNIPQLSTIQENIIVLLWRTGSMSGQELKNALGYVPGVASHTIDTAIYNLRKLFGHDFIQYEHGVYKIGNL